MDKSKEDVRTEVCIQLLQQNADKNCPVRQKYCLSCDHEFNNCTEAEQYIDRAQNDSSLVIGEAQPQLQSTLTDKKISKLPDGRFKASVKVTWSRDAAKSKTTLPDWCWPNMTHAEQAALNQFVDRLKVHEDGHFVVCR